MRCWCAAGVAIAVWCLATAPGLAGEVHDHGHQRPRSPETAAWVTQAEAALAGGDVALALKSFEQAAAREHATDIEQGIVRAHMQAGEYRRALAFAAHTAGAHGDEVGGAVLYAWLLNAGGQGAFARQLLEGVERRVPGQAVVALALAQLRAPWPRATDALLLGPTRLAPMGVPGAMPPGLHVVGSGVLIDQGRRALVPADLVARPEAVWLRDGLGREAQAEVERRLDPLGLVLLKLASPMPGAASWRRPPRDAFAGSPVYTLEHAVASSPDPAWPLLRLGFLGAGQGLGIDVPAGPHGGPVVDAAGRLVGVALPGSSSTEGAARVPVSTLAETLGGLLGPVAESPPNARLPMDELYELALPLTLQVLMPSRPSPDSSKR